MSSEIEQIYQINKLERLEVIEQNGPRIELFFLSSVRFSYTIFHEINEIERASSKGQLAVGSISRESSPVVEKGTPGQDTIWFNSGGEDRNKIMINEATSVPLMVHI